MTVLQDAEQDPRKPGRPPLSEGDRHDRIDFVLQRLRMGFSTLETQKQFAKKYNYSSKTAKKWVDHTFQTLSGTNERRRKHLHALVVEMMHSQLTGYQNDLVTMQTQIQSQIEMGVEKQALTNQIPSANEQQLRLIYGKIKMLEVTPDKICDLIEKKSRVRERLSRLISELCRIQGLYAGANDWRTALNVLLDNRMLPSSVASHLLGAIESFETQMNRGVEEEGAEEDDVIATGDISAALNSALENGLDDSGLPDELRLLLDD
jgi:hypothetical protein